MGLETTLKRPIINTRDEPHADAEKYRRLHVIVGDANLCEVSTYLKLGTTALVLAMIEDGVLPGDLTLARPVHEIHAVSHDPTLRHRAKLRDGRELTALQLQGEYLEQARKHVEDRLGSDADPVTLDVLDRWESVLDRLARDPLLLRARAGLGGQEADPGRLPRPRRPRLVARTGCTPSTCSGPTCGPTRALPPAGRAPAGSSAWSATTRSATPSATRRRTPARTSAASAWRGTATRSPPPPGTR